MAGKRWYWLGLMTLGWLGVLGGMAGGSASPPQRPQQIFRQLLTLPSVYNPIPRPDDDGNGTAVETVVTAGTPDLETPSLPSLWWNRNQILPQWGGDRLVQDWVAFKVTMPETAVGPEASTQGEIFKGLRVIDVQIDRQYWDRLVAQRQRHPGAQFALLNQWGTAASSYGYNLRLYLGDRLIGVYSCDFDRHPLLSQTPDIEVPADQLSDLSCFAELGPFTPRRVLR